MCVGQSILMTGFLLQKDAALPEQLYLNEQTRYLVSGKIRLYIYYIAHNLNLGDN